MKKHTKTTKSQTKTKVQEPEVTGKQVMHIAWDRRRDTEPDDGRIYVESSTTSHPDPSDINVFIASGIPASLARRKLLAIADQLDEVSTIGVEPEDPDAVPF